MPYRLRDFLYEALRIPKKYTKESDLPGWNDMGVWKDFRPPYISETIWAEYIQHVKSERFT